MADLCFTGTAVLALFSIVVWAFDIDTIIFLRGLYLPMAPPAGIQFLLLSAAYFLYTATPGQLLRRTSLLLVPIMVVFNVVALASSLAGRSGQIQSLVPFTNENIVYEGTNISATYMSPVAIESFVAISIALFFSFLAGSRRLRFLSALAAIITFSLAAFSLLGYLYGTPFLYAGGSRPIALTASISFLFLAFGIILHNGRDAWPLSFFVGPSIKARLMRTFLPTGAALVVLEGFLIARLHIYLDPGELALLTSILLLLTLVALGSALIAFVGGSIDRETERRLLAEKRLKETIAELEISNYELEQFAYVASHDLQEPLRMVSSYVQLLSKRYGDRLDGDAHDFIAFAQDGARRMQLLINDLLEYSRVGTKGSSLKPVDLNQAYDTAINNLQLHMEDVHASITRERLPIVLADESQMVQVFQNLLANAIKFRREEEPRVHIGIRDAGGEWELSVRDNGIGIDRQHGERIFQIFQRLHARDKYEGTGIGLAIVKRIVERHGGRIWFESAMGEGTTFYFTIPKKEMKRNEH